MEGPDCLNGEACDPSQFVLPELYYSHKEGCAVIGGHVYRGSAIPSIEGQYFFADFCRSWVHSVSFDMPGDVPIDWSTQIDLGGEHPISWGEDGLGELYISTFEGSVFRIAAGS